jgi:hypothetical protein
LAGWIVYGYTVLCGVQLTFANGEGLEDIIRQFKVSYQHLLDEHLCTRPLLGKAAILGCETAIQGLDTP